MTTMDRDAQIMAEADKQRAHDLERERILAQTTQERHRHETLRRESRHQMFAWLAGITGIVAIVLTVILSIANAKSEDRAKEIKIREQQNQVAETCIRDGNIWLNGDCIPARKN